jgi:hypothetical protein
MVTRITRLTARRKEQLPAHADKWLEIGLRTGAADVARFEDAARRCYEAIDIPWHGNIVWVGSPRTLALAAPLTVLFLEWLKLGRLSRDRDAVRVRGSVHGWLRTLGCRVRHSIDEVASPSKLCGLQEGLSAAGRLDTVEAAVQAAVRRAVAGLADRQVREAVAGAVRRALDAVAPGSAQSAVGRALDQVVDCALDQVDGDGPVDGRQILTAIRFEMDSSRHGYLPGQLWIGDWRSGPVYASFLREVCGLALPDGLWEGWIAYEETVQSACWWYPHRQFLMVSQRPVEIHHQLQTAGNRYQLHHPAAPAMFWPDGFQIHADRGRQVPSWVIEQPEALTIPAIEAEANAEVRRVMIERYGWSRYMQDCGAQVVQALPLSHPIAGLAGARLLRKDLPEEPEPIVYLEMVNSTPEPDGTRRRYLERIDPKAYGGDAGRFCHAAMASRWRHRGADGELRLTFERWQDYLPAQES